MREAPAAMRQTLFLSIPLAAALLAAPLTRAESVSTGCPSLVRAGVWEISQSRKIRTSAGAFFGGRNERNVNVSGAQCGDRVIVTGEKRRLVFDRVEGDRYATEPEPHSEGSVTFTIVYEMTVESPESMSVDLVIRGLTSSLPFGGTRAISFTFVDDAPSKPLECECDAFDGYLDERIAENELFRNLYQNPRYWEKPADFPQSPNWDAYAYELLINELAEDVPYEAAIKAVIESTKSADYGESGDAATESESAPPGATTDTGTCEVEILDGKPDTCFPRIFLDEVKYHESLHATRCVEMRTQRNQWLNAVSTGASPQGGEPQSYRNLVNDPREAGLEEARAYQASIEWLKNWKSRNCGT